MLRLEVCKSQTALESAGNLQNTVSNVKLCSSCDGQERERETD